MFDFVSFIPRAVVQGIPLLFGSTGETLSEKAGNLNLGIPGVMYTGGICGVIGAFLYEQSVPSKADIVPVMAVLIPLLSCLLGSLIMEGKDALEEGLFSSLQIVPVLVGILVAAVSGYLALRFMLKIISTVPLSRFAIYLALIGIAFLICQLAGANIFPPFDIPSSV